MAWGHNNSLAPKEVSLFPWPVGIGVEHGAGGRLLLLEARSRPRRHG